MSKLVKMYPFSKRNGWVMRSYTIADRKNPMRFTSERGWYEVDNDIAEKLAKVPQEDRRPKGPKAFMIANDKDHAKELDAEIAEIMNDDGVEEKGTIDSPVRVRRPGARASAGGTDAEASETGRSGGKPRKRGRATTAG